MTTGPKKITRALESLRKALLQQYDDEDLHQLRVNIRRARALLKPQTNRRSAGLRKSWSRLAQRTNAARDWDTLAMYAGEALAPEHWSHLRPLVEGYRAEARQEVLGALQADSWDSTLARWRKRVKKMGSEAFAEVTLAGENRKAAKRVLKASRKAQATEDEQRWHTLRIAVKNLRYKLDNTELEEGRERDELDATRTTCERLQDALGDWHDTVVHRALLARIAADDRAADDSRLAAAIAALAAGIEAQRLESLRCATRILQEDKLILLAAAGKS